MKPKYTKQQYCEFFNNFESTVVGLVYIPRTFASQRLTALYKIIIDNLNDEEAMKTAISSDPKLKNVIKYMYENGLNSINPDTELPDFIDAIRLWKKNMKYEIKLVWEHK